MIVKFAFLVLKASLILNQFVEKRIAKRRSRPCKKTPKAQWITVVAKEEVHEENEVHEETEEQKVHEETEEQELSEETEEQEVQDNEDQELHEETEEQLHEETEEQELHEETEEHEVDDEETEEQKMKEQEVQAVHEDNEELEEVDLATPHDIENEVERMKNAIQATAIVVSINQFNPSTVELLLNRYNLIKIKCCDHIMVYQGNELREFGLPINILGNPNSYFLAVVSYIAGPSATRTLLNLVNDAHTI